MRESPNTSSGSLRHRACEEGVEEVVAGSTGVDGSEESERVASLPEVVKGQWEVFFREPEALIK